MKIKYHRYFVCEVPAIKLVEVLAKLIEDWEYDDATPEEERTMGISDVFRRLNTDGLLLYEEEDNVEPQPQLDETDWPEGFYTADTLREELKTELEEEDE